MVVAVRRRMSRSPRLVFALASLFACAAFGQTPPIVLAPLSLTTTTGISTFTFGAGACNAMVPVTWTNNSLFGSPCGDMQVWITAGECGDTPGSGDVTLPSVISALVFSVRTGTFTVDVSQLPGFNSSDGGTCGSSGIQVSNKVCAAIPLQAGLTCISNHAQPLEIDYDTEPPAAPSIDAVKVEDGALGVTVSGSSDTLNVDVQAKGPNDADFGHDVQIFLANGSTGTVHGLANGQPYELRAFAVDAAGNSSGFSDTVTGTPLHAVGFWEAYRRAGGEAQGCSTAMGLPLVAVTLGWLLRSRRRTRRR